MKTTARYRKIVHHITEGESKCDFCSGPNPIARFPCSTRIEMGDARVRAVSDDDWGACVGCASTVERARNLDSRSGAAALADHVIERALKAEGTPEAILLGDPGIRMDAWRSLTKLYRQVLPALGVPHGDVSLPNGTERWTYIPDPNGDVVLDVNGNETIAHECQSCGEDYTGTLGACDPCLDGWAAEAHQGEVEA